MFSTSASSSRLFHNFRCVLHHIFRILRVARQPEGYPVAGVAAIYSAVEEVAGYPVRSVYTINDLPGYASYDYRDCPYCKAGQKLDALVNSFGYSAL